MNCTTTIQTVSLEYSRNMGLSWQLFKYLILNSNQTYIIHEDLLDEMRYDYVLIRIVFLSNTPKCLQLEHVRQTRSLNFSKLYCFFLQ